MKPHCILTHPGTGHKDDFLACCIAMEFFDIEAIERREPTSEEIDDPLFLKLDVGKVYDRNIYAFDHHQSSELPCALHLLCEYLGIGTLIEKMKPWYQTVNWIDTLGPKHFYEKMGFPYMNRKYLGDPISGYILRSFSRKEKITSNDDLFHLMAGIGTEIADDIDERVERIQILESRATVVNAKGLNILVFLDEITRPQYALGDFREIWEERNGLTIAGSITRDNRSGGFSLYRYDDHPKINFTRVNSKRTTYIHPNGFLAIVNKEVDQNELLYMFMEGIL